MFEKFLRRPAGSLPVVFVVIALVMTGCDHDRSVADSPPAVPVRLVQEESAPATSPPAVASLTGLPPNELGEIMVLEYHRLGEPEGEFRRTAENFRSDLQRLYDGGYRPITVRQMVRGEIDLPLGASPVVFTIDDSSTGQFYFLEDGSIDPNTMVGMWEEFRRLNPDWRGGATWCVLPAAEHPSNFFGEAPDREVPRAERGARIQRKIDHLIANDHEICNHTLYHARLDRATGPVQVQEWIGRGEDSIRVFLPDGYEIVTLALPLGKWPADSSLAWRGTHQGREYTYDAILEVLGGPNVSPFDSRFDPHSVKRAIVAPGHLERYLAGYERDTGRRFVSDGNPATITIPAASKDRVARDRWSHLEVRTVSDDSESPAGRE